MLKREELTSEMIDRIVADARAAGSRHGGATPESTEAPTVPVPQLRRAALVALFALLLVSLAGRTLFMLWEPPFDGTIRFDVPSSPAGVHVTGVRLTFKDGEVVEASADEGEDYLRHALAVDDGAKRLGELGIGTNFGIDRPTGTILFDEKIGGTVHLALGRSYPETGGKNRSSLHWDLICDLRPGGRLYADGELVQQHGRFIGLV